MSLAVEAVASGLGMFPVVTFSRACAQGDMRTRRMSSNLHAYIVQSVPVVAEKCSALSHVDRSLETNMQ
jgi:hypothetical protein